MKNVQKPKLGNTISHLIGLLDSLIGLLTLGAYCPYWEFDFMRYRIERGFAKAQKRKADESL